MDRHTRAFCPRQNANLSDSEATASSGIDEKSEVMNCHPLDEAITGILEVQGLRENKDMDGRKRKKTKTKK